MNPPTPGPLTVLLVPPEGDTALLADECGGRVPTLDIHVPADGSPGWTLPTPYTVTPVKDLPPTEARGLLLVHEGTPVAMGCDRFVRCVNAVTRSPGMLGRFVLRLFDDYGSVEDVVWTTQREAHRIGARVVLLRDGREVTE